MENNKTSISSKEKFIRTSDGFKSKSKFEGQFVLPYEHICQNLCDFLIKSKNALVKEDEEISLKNISDISLNIYSSIKNLYLESDSTKCADELTLLREYKCGLVVDATTKRNGQNIRALREIAKLSGIDICFGYTLKEDFFDSSSPFNFDKTLNEIRYEIVYGYEDLIPSFLGEIIVSDPNSFPLHNENKLFEILFKVVQEFQIPLFIKLNSRSLNSSNNKLFFEYFEKKCDEHKINRKLVVFIHTKTDQEGNYNEDVPVIIDYILLKGYSLIIGLYDCDYVCASKIKSNGESENENFSKIAPYFFKDKLNFIVNILKAENKKFLDQIMISNNINFRIQLKKYGGFGYNNLFRNYFKKIISAAELTDEEIKLIFSENLLNLLCWWEPPKKSEKKVKYIICSNCGKEAEESENIFRKLENVYCSIKCLKENSSKLNK